MKPLILVALLTLAACAEMSLMGEEDIPMLLSERGALVVDRQTLPPYAFGQLN